MPNTGVDPLNVAAHILIALQEIHARALAISDQAILTIGTMNDGIAANVIPDTATMGGTIRTFDFQPWHLVWQQRRFYLPLKVLLCIFQSI